MVVGAPGILSGFSCCEVLCGVDAGPGGEMWVKRTAENKSNPKRARKKDAEQIDALHNPELAKEAPKKPTQNPKTPPSWSELVARQRPQSPAGDPDSIRAPARRSGVPRPGFLSTMRFTALTLAGASGAPRQCLGPQAGSSELGNLVPATFSMAVFLA